MSDPLYKVGDRVACTPTWAPKTYCEAHVIEVYKFDYEDHGWQYRVKLVNPASPGMSIWAGSPKTIFSWAEAGLMVAITEGV